MTIVLTKKLFQNCFYQQMIYGVINYFELFIVFGK